MAQPTEHRMQLSYAPRMDISTELVIVL